MMRRAPADASRLDGLDVDDCLDDPALKQQFVTPMFDVIAPVYDRFTRVFSFGMDARWKRAVQGAALDGLPSGARVLDLACGTGDLALAVARARPDARVTGVDAAPRMVAAAEGRRAEGAVPNVAYRVGDLGALDEGDESVDLVTAGYAFRNVPDWHAALRETARVLRRGGRLVTLDFYQPEFVPWRVLLLAYLRAAGDVVGWAWHRRPVVYGYISRSIARFTTAGGFSRALQQAGLAVEGERHFLGGGIAVHVARRMDAPPL